jgi:signal transduction histidine kinase
VSLPASVPGDDTDAQHFRLLVTPTNRPGTLVVVGASRKTIDDAVGQSELWLLALGGPAVVFAGIAAYLIAGAALRPVERMRAQAAGFGVDTQPAELLVPGTRDELDRLAQTLNDLLGRLRTALEQERSFVADAGHELRTPLAILSGELELASRQRRSVTELRQTIHVAREETDRLVRLSEQLLVLAHADSGSLIARRETDVGSVLVASRDSALASRPDNGVRLELSVPSGLTAYVDPDRLRQAVDNLLVNALRYSPRGSAIEVTATQEGGSDDGTLTVSVRDHGPGFALEFLPHAFDRFRRADEARGRTGTSGGASGAGLGLAIVRSIVEAHGGSATAENCPDAGARVTLTFSPEGANSAQPD